MPDLPGFSDIRKAHKSIGKYAHRTPVLTSSALNELTGADLYFKCENFQKTGAFKFRGATNAVLNLSAEEASKGVATHSSGNHAAALASAAGTRGIMCYVVMPENAPKIKVEAVRHYGAGITFCSPDLHSREQTLNKVIAKTGAVFIHPYNRFDVICGQGTSALEFIEEVPALDTIIAPVGGGGLLSGTGIASKAMNPGIAVYGAEPLNADDACRSLKAGRIIPSENPVTIADGLLTSLGDMTFAIIRRHIDAILTAPEESIKMALRLIWTRMKIVVEPSAAVPLAVVLENRTIFFGKKTGIILSGGNMELPGFPVS